MSRALVHQGVISTAAQMMGRTANFALPFLLVYQFGVSARTDTLFLVIAVSFYIGGSLANAASDAIVVELSSGKTGKSIRRFSLYSACISAGMFLIVWGFIDDQHPTFTLVLTVAGGFIAVFGLLSSYYVAACYTKNNFFLPGASWCYRWVAIVPLFATSDPDWGLATFISLIAIADGFRFWHLRRWAGRRAAATVTELELKSIASYVLAAASSGLNPIVDRLVAGTLASGAVTAVELAERAVGLVLLVPTAGLLQVMNVEINKKIGVNKRWDYGRLLFHVFWMSGLWALGFIVLVHLPAFGDIARAFDMPYKLADIRAYITVLLSSLPAMLVGMVLVRILIAYRQAKLVLIIAVSSVILNAVLSFWLSVYLGVYGILLATLAVYSFTSIALLALCAFLRGTLAGTDQPPS